MPCSLLPLPTFRFVESQSRLTACLVVCGLQYKAWATPNCEVACAMSDVIMLALVIVCFALAAAYASLCEHLLAPSAGKPVSP